MSTYDFVHLTLYAMGGAVRGKTRLQKAVYFLGLLTETIDDLGYRPHYYGPYSPEVAGAANRLRALGFADQTVSGRGAVDSSGFEVARYDLSLSEEGRRTAEVKSKEYPEKWDRIRKAVETFKKAQDMDYVELSIAAKTYFMLGRNKGTMQVDALVPLAQEFGWSVKPEQVQEAARFLDSMGLVHLRRS